MQEGNPSAKRPQVDEGGTKARDLSNEDDTKESYLREQLWKHPLISLNEGLDFIPCGFWGDDWVPVGPDYRFVCPAALMNKLERT